ncbi:MAG: cell wall-binding repeat-containing protein, partial [Raoultibacter sp.]
FADALSASSGAYVERAPVFLVDETGDLSAVQKTAIEQGIDGGLFGRVVVTGDENAVSAQAESYMKEVCPAGMDQVERLGGVNRYETSAFIATWMVNKGILSWDNAAFTTGNTAYDALGGGAAQGQAKSVLLLIAEDNYETAYALSSHRVEVATAVKFFGGLPSIPGKVRSYVMSTSLKVDPFAYTPYAITLDGMVDYEYKAYKQTVDKNTLREKLNPSPMMPPTANFYYQFADLGNGYSGLFTASDLDAYIEERVKSEEQSKGVTSTLHGKGQVIIDAAKKYDINEVYLLAHAGLESGWGCSLLAQGTVGGYDGCYNFFGFSALDSDPEKSGAEYAKRKGWNSPEKALLGGAQAISTNYIHEQEFEQRTLYNMKWDLYNAINNPASHYEYATDIAWATKIGNVMFEVYAGHGLTMHATGLVFDIPQYQQ